MSKAVYPGTFDPITYGHLDVIRRGASVFEELIVAVGPNPEKVPLFTVQERVGMIEQVIEEAGLTSVEVISYDGMTVDYVRMAGAHVILKGMRTVSDFENEFQQALTNRALAGDIETLFVMTKQEYAFFRATNVKEVCRMGGDVRPFVPPLVARLLREKMRQLSS